MRFLRGCVTGLKHGDEKILSVVSSMERLRNGDLDSSVRRHLHQEAFAIVKR